MSAVVVAGYCDGGRTTEQGRKGGGTAWLDEEGGRRGRLEATLWVFKVDPFYVVIHSIIGTLLRPVYCHSLSVSFLSVPLLPQSQSSPKKGITYGLLSTTETSHDYACFTWTGHETDNKSHFYATLSQGTVVSSLFRT